jgi:hypothetical protein
MLILRSKLLILPCGLNVVVAMTKLSEAIEKVRKQLIGIMQDKELKNGRRTSG